MARAIWNGAINFGLVHIPVSVWKATRPQDVHFRTLHAKDHAPLEQKRFCSVEQIEVPNDEIVKGFEISSGEFVVVDSDELEALEPENPHSIDIADFVELAEIDPIYFETAYYLAPGKGAAKPYSLLVAAMEQSGRAAIARFVMRTKEHLVIMRPVGNAITLSTLFYADEVMPVDEVPGIPKSARPSKQELEMAIRLVDSMTKPFEPENYEDKHRERIMELLEEKAKGKKIAAPAKQAEPAKVIDLVSALQASLGEAPTPKKASASKAKVKSGTKKSTPAKKKPATKKKEIA